MFVYLSVIVYCGPPPTIANGHHNVFTAYVIKGFVVTYVCDDFHRFPGGGTHSYITCLPSGEYKEEISNCEG